MIANSNADNQFNTILNGVRHGGLVFIGTPHSGVNLNGIDADTFIKVLVGVVFNLDVDARHDLVEDLRSNSNSRQLFDLTDDFRQLIAAKRIGVVTLLESKKTRLRGFPDILVYNLSST